MRLSPITAAMGLAAKSCSKLRATSSRTPAATMQGGNAPTKCLGSGLQGYVPLERAVARRMEWREGVWVLLEGRRFHFAAGEAVATTSFDTLSLPNLSLLPSDFARQQKDPEEMNYAELADYIARATLNGEDATRQRVDLHLKISFPLTSFIIIALGATARGPTPRRAGLANSFGLGVLICFVYYSCVKAGQALGWNQILSPWLGAWVANLLFAVLALVFAVARAQIKRPFARRRTALGETRIGTNAQRMPCSK